MKNRLVGRANLRARRMCNSIAESTRVDCTVSEMRIFESSHEHYHLVEISNTQHRLGSLLFLFFATNLSASFARVHVFRSRIIFSRRVIVPAVGSGRKRKAALDTKSAGRGIDWQWAGNCWARVGDSQWRLVYARRRRRGNSSTRT